MIKPSVGRVVWFYKFNAVTGAAGAAQRRGAGCELRELDAVPN